MNFIEWEPTETGAYEAFDGLYNLYVERDGKWAVRYDGGCIGRGQMPDQLAGKHACEMIYETHHLLQEKR